MAFKGLGQRTAARPMAPQGLGARRAPVRQEYDPLDDVAGAEVFSRLPYIPAGGRHLMTVDEIQIKDTRSGRMFIINVTLEDSESDVEPGRYGVSFNLSDQYGYGIRDTKKFLVAVLGETPGDPEGEARLAEVDALSKENIYEAAGEDQPLSGRKVYCLGVIKPTKGGPSAKNPEGVVTNYEWYPAEQ